MRDPVLLGTEAVERAAHQMIHAAERMASVANQMEFAFEQRRRWEEEYLARIEAIVDRELKFYGDSTLVTATVCGEEPR